MTISAKHAFTSLKGDGTDATLIRPSNWNAEHVIQLAANKLIGRLTAGTGAAEEIPLTAFAATLLAATDVAALSALLGIHTAGDFKLTLKTTADTGWVMCNDGTIGKGGTSATARANDDCYNLYKILYALPDAYAPVVGGRSGSGADVDWQTRPIGLTKMLGRALAVAGSGSGLTARALGQILGEETHQLTLAESPSHNHGGNTGYYDASHSHTTTLGEGGANLGGNFIAYATSGALGWGSAAVASSTASLNHNHTIPSAGSDGAHNNIQPTSFINVMVKL